MTKKRKKSKGSPGNQSSTKRKNKEMAQNGSQDGVTPVQTTMNYGSQQQIGQIGQLQTAQASQYYSNQPYQNMQNMQNANYVQPLNFNPSQMPGTPGFQQPNTQSPPPPPPTPPIPHMMQSNDQALSAILKRLESMESKLSRLDAMHTSVSNITAHIESIDRKINLVECKLSDLENSRAFDSSLLDDINKRQKDMESIISKMQQFEKEQKKTESGLKSEIQDLKCRSMRDNLLFYKIGEEKDENCEDKVLSFIEDNLKIENAKAEIKLHRAHRIGAYNPSKVRPIVAKFVLYTDRERVRKSAKLLRGTPYGISEQFPKDVMDTRRKLVPIMKQARQEGKDAFIRVDKLYINNQLHNPDN